jgi:hypothetical protein
MQIPKDFTNFANRVTNSIKESRKTKSEESDSDKLRIERELAYAKKIKQSNKRLQALTERRKQIQSRRGR